MTLKEDRKTRTRDTSYTSVTIILTWNLSCASTRVADSHNHNQKSHRWRRQTATGIYLHPL